MAFATTQVKDDGDSDHVLAEKVVRHLLGILVGSQSH